MTSNANITDIFESYSVDQLIALLVQADDLYFNDEQPSVTDAQYDAIKLHAQRLDPTNSYFTQVGSMVRGGKVHLPHKMGSLDQVHHGDAAKWIKKYALDADQFVISDKLDGNSLLLAYSPTGKFQSAYTRGDGFQGADVTRHVIKMPSVPKSIYPTGNVTLIRAESIIAPANFKRINTGKHSRGGRVYKNPRNCVAGQMNASEVSQEMLNVIDCVAYEVVDSTLSKQDQFKFLSDNSFHVAVHEIVPASQINDIDLSLILAARRANTAYEIDGIVIDINSSQTRARIATDDLNPTYAVKFKIADVDNSAVTEVTGVEINLSKGGYLKPTILFKSVDLVGVTISRCSGFNMKFIKDNLIGPGATIRIVRAGDVIPFIANVVTPMVGNYAKWFDQLTGSFGQTNWSTSGVDMILVDANSNDTVKFEQLKEFFAALDVDHLGEGNLKPMFDAGFHTPESIIPMTQEDFGSLIGSSANGKKIFAGMRKAFTDVPLYKLMGAHPSTGRGVGSRKIKKLYDAWNGDLSKCNNIDAIIAVDGFDKKTATKIVNGIDEFNDFLAAISPYITLAKYEAKKTGHLTSKVFVFTGFRAADLEQQIVNAGGTIGTGVSSKTTYLVASDPNSNSGKIQKARDAGISVIGVEQLKALL